MAGKLTISTGVWVGFGTLYLARDLGYFSEQGLDVELTESGGEAEAMLAAMAAGRLSGSCDTVEMMARTRTDALCFKAVVVLDDSSGADGILTAPDVQDIREFKGQPIALHEGSSSDLLLKYLARREGMAESDFKIVNMRPDDTAAAFIAGRVPAAVTYEPNLTFVAAAHKGKVLFDSSQAPGLIVDVVVLRCEIIEQQPQDVQALVAGILKASDFIQTHPDQAFDIMRKYVGGYLDSAAQFGAAAKGAHYYGAADNFAYLGSAAAPGKVQALLNLLIEIEGAQIRKPLYTDLIEPKFLNAAGTPPPTGQ